MTTDAPSARLSSTRELSAAYAVGVASKLWKLHREYPSALDGQRLCCEWAVRVANRLRRLTSRISESCDDLEVSVKILWLAVYKSSVYIFTTPGRR
jgi:hypothetical protein